MLAQHISLRALQSSDGSLLQIPPIKKASMVRTREGLLGGSLPLSPPPSPAVEFPWLF